MTFNVETGFIGPFRWLSFSPSWQSRDFPEAFVPLGLALCFSSLVPSKGISRYFVHHFDERATFFSELPTMSLWKRIFLENLL